jgi:hypothetical protein
VEKGTITVNLRTEEMPADIMTKALTQVKVEEMLIGLKMKICLIKGECWDNSVFSRLFCFVAKKRQGSAQCLFKS